MSVDTLSPLLPAVPLLAALAGFLLPLRSRRAAAALGVAGAAAALAVAVALAARYERAYETSLDWVRLGDLQVTLGVRVDGPATAVALAVCAVALAVQVYSVAYLRDDDRYPPYAAQVSLFTAAMLLVVVSGDLIGVLVGWEVMGACSYLLIAHDRTLPAAPRAAVKAFLVTRVGDVGFLLGIAVLGVGAGSFRIADVLATDYAPGTLTAACLLLLAGVAGKSAQFPLHTWLPDAMAGPTPISALIHAATMVAAGVYAVTRLYPLFRAAPVALTVLGVLAAVTILLGALAATAQDDIKRVLAWSTVSQLGYMTGALAVGSTSAALFHLLTHAAFKALLFLAAGCVIHAVGTNLMSAMGGLRRQLPVTFWCTAIGLGALAGLPPLAGFWSKEAILHAAVTAQAGRGAPPVWVAWLVWLTGLLGVAVTAWYATRLLLRTFFGPSRVPAGATSHDPPALMRWPVVLLAVPGAALGLAAFSDTFAGRLFPPATGAVPSDLLPASHKLIHLGPELLLPLALLAAGAGLAWWRWRRAPGADPAAALPAAFAEAFRLDEVQHALVVRPVAALARVSRRADEAGVDGLV
ncbi:MAG TPA: NADH-quinone oxidoreductase subunit L, partial [Pilimelia sp.]|nr:NADH-quinone oxidoreductase subunit L [Pilimelia sp.]